LFVGGLKEDCEEDNLRDYFSQFGSVASATIVMDKETGKKKGFGFIEFDDAVDVGICKFSIIFLTITQSQLRLISFP
jgi:RNA recognition motif-containing protein